LHIATSLKAKRENAATRLFVRDVGLNRFLMHKDFTKERLHENPEANHLDFAKAKPSCDRRCTRKNLDLDANADYEGTLVDNSFDYADFSSGALRHRASELVGDAQDCKNLLLARQQQNPDLDTNFHRNLRKLLIHGVDLSTFGLTRSKKVDYEQLKQRLMHYELSEVTLGLPFYTPATTAAEFEPFLTATDRMVKVSCELGLHWARCDPERQPLQALLNLTSP